MLEIMKIYGWDFYTYEAQPYWVIELARKKMTVEAKLSRQNAKAQEDGQ